MRIKNSKLILYVFYIYIFVFISCESEPDMPPPQDDIPLEDYESSYDIIQGEIFDKYCISCHIEGNPHAVESGLILTGDISYESLINVIPNNEYAAGDSLFRVSTASSSDTSAHQGLWESFLIEKIDAPRIDHLYNDHPGYNSIMPLGGPYLTNGHIAFIGDWIIKGAPKTGHVADITSLDDIERYDSTFTPLAIPENGIQIHLGPFEVLPQQETEFFYYSELNDSIDLYINRIEIEMRSGSHHFILYTYPENFWIAIEDSVERHLRNPDGSYNESVLSIMAHQVFFTGTQWPQLDVAFPTGVALRIPPNTAIDQNPHYPNYSDDIILGEVYTNLHFADAEPEHIAEILQLNVIEELYLLPNKTTTIEKIFMFEDILIENGLDSLSITTIDKINILQLFSHAHEKMLIFEVFIIDNDPSTEDEQIYYNNDWEHPPINYYGEGWVYEHLVYPAIEIFPEEGLRLKASYYNWTDEALGFGFLSTDEMMILFGYFYTQ